MTIRDEQPEDVSAIHLVNEAVFGTPEEADLIDRLRHEGVVLASHVADDGGRIVGHILFSRMSIETATGSISAVALAPMAVLPEHQRQGIGGKLIRHGLDGMRARGEQIVIVVGHPEYYPRFGFSSRLTRSLASPFPPGPFMALELSAGALSGVSGKVKYPAAFGIPFEP